MKGERGWETHRPLGAIGENLQQVFIVSEEEAPVWAHVRGALRREPFG